MKPANHLRAASARSRGLCSGGRTRIVSVTSKAESEGNERNAEDDRIGGYHPHKTESASSRRDEYDHSKKH